jgi:hypothetical protein
MDHRSLVALTAAALLLLQLQAYLLPGLRLAHDPLMVLARHEAQRAADLRRLGVDLAAATAGLPARHRPATVASASP